MKSRIDYVGLTLPSNNPEEKLVQQEYLQAMFDHVAEQGAGERGTIEFNSRYDGRGNWFFMIDVSGPLADRFFDILDLKYVEAITRLDYRRTLEGQFSFRDLRNLEDTIRSLNTANRNVRRESSRKRSKKEHRDAGGELIKVGSEASDRCLTLYQKQDESGPACEVKLKGQYVARLLQEAKNRQRLSGGEKVSLGLFIRTHLAMQTSDFIQDVTGLSVPELEQYSRQCAERAISPWVAIQESVKEEFDLMPREEQMELFEQLRMGLFGDEITSGEAI